MAAVGQWVSTRTMAFYSGMKPFVVRCLTVILTFSLMGHFGSHRTGTSQSLIPLYADYFISIVKKQPCQHEISRQQKCE